LHFPMIDRNVISWTCEREHKRIFENIFFTCLSNVPW
jgi:hypothetical protein